MSLSNIILFLIYIFSIDIIGIGQCAKELVRSECENKTFKVISIMQDSVLNLVVKKLECPIKPQSENEI